MAFEALANTALAVHAMEGLALAGLSMEAGAIAGALTSNRGTNITTRQAAANRQIIYGQQRVGGVFVYKSTTGSHHDQFNYVIVLAGHQSHSIQNLYLDGRQVHWDGTGPGYTTRNGVAFGGNADGNTYTGPNGITYNFGGKVYCEARYGDQIISDVISGLTANDPIWAAKTVSGVTNYPSAMDCTYVYLKVEYDTTLFPGEPEIRFTVNGKNTILDPRTGLTGYTSNWALIAADVITDPVYGLGDNSINQAQLIAAANVCDEQVALAWVAGNTEARYTTNYHYDTSVTPGDVLATMMAGAAGRLSRIGSEWYLWPAYWQGPSFSFDEGDLTDTLQWIPYRSTKDLINRVNGTYIAPTFPYNIAGNLYDKNGFYNGMLQNNFPFAFQPTNFPQYAADALHGFAADEYLIADGGHQFPTELALNTVLSIGQAQRVAKINLLRNRQQGSSSFEMSLEAFRMQPTDVMQFSFAAANGWVNKVLEVVGVSLRVDDQNGVPCLRCNVNVIETAASVYAWTTGEELNVYDQADTPLQGASTPPPPTNMALNSGTGVNVVGSDGTLIPRIEITWDTPQDVQTTQIVTQYQLAGALAWETGPVVAVTENLTYIAPVVVGGVYNVRIRGVRPSGVGSSWVFINGYTVASVSSFLGTLGGEVTTITPIAYAGLSANLIPNGNFVLGNINGWGAVTGFYSAPSYAGGGISVPGHGAAVSQAFNVTPGQKYRFSFTGMVNGAGTQSVFHRICYSSTYQPNIALETSGLPSFDFLSGGSLTSSLKTYSYDWVCPAGVYYASLGMYNILTAPLLYTNVSAQDYVASAQWGSDVTTLNIPTEMLINGSFEQGLTGWTLGGGAAAVDTTVSKYGTQSLKGIAADYSQDVNLLAGHTYLYQGWVMTDGATVGGTSQGSAIYVFDPSSHVTIQKISGTAMTLPNYPGVGLAATVATGWTLLQMTFTVSTNGTYGIYLNANYNGSTAAHVWFDGLSLEDISGGPDVTGVNQSASTATIGNHTSDDLPSGTNTLIPGNYYLGIGSSTVWVNLGRWSFGSVPRNLKMEYQAGVGFNSGSHQQVVTDIFMRSANSTAAPNLSGLTWLGYGNTAVINAVKAVAAGGSTSASNNAWDIYANVAAFSAGTLIVYPAPGDTFVYNGSFTTDPGAASSTVVVGTGQQVTDGSGNVTNVGGQPSSGITPIVGLMPVEVGADKTLNHVKTAVDQGLLLNPSSAAVQMQSNSLYTVGSFNVLANDPSDVFNINVTLQWQPNGTTFTNPATIWSFMTGWVDASPAVGTTPLWGAGPYSGYPFPSGFSSTFNGWANPWSGGSLKAFGFGTAPTTTTTVLNNSQVNFFGSVTGLSAGSHNISVTFNSWAANPFLTYIYATLQQISS